jgi:hypothetical protein
LYDNFMAEHSEGAYWFDSFLGSKYKDSTSWLCMVKFEAMLKETTPYADFMVLLKEILELIDRSSFVTENPADVEALQKLFDKSWDAVLKGPRQLSSQEKQDIEADWMHVAKKEKEEKEKSLRKREKKQEQDTEKVKKEMTKEMERLRLKNGCAPPKLLKVVVERGRDPIYAYLLPKLDAFKASDRYKRCADDWGLVAVPVTDSRGRHREPDFSGVTPEALYDNFMAEHSEGAYWFDSFLGSKYKDSTSWLCMVKFEAMLKETTPYADFMDLLKEILELIDRSPFVTENPADVEALQKLYVKFKGLDLDEASRKS